MGVDGVYRQLAVHGKLPGRKANAGRRAQRPLRGQVTADLPRHRMATQLSQGYYSSFVGEFEVGTHDRLSISGMRVECSARTGRRCGGRILP